MAGRRGMRADPFGDGSIAHLEDVDRSRSDGFRYYWKQRKEHYNDVFGTDGRRIVWQPEELACVADLWAAVIEQAKSGAGEEFPPNLDFFTEEGGMYDWIRDHA